jgi:hypothetical protein
MLSLMTRSLALALIAVGAAVAASAARSESKNRIQGFVVDAGPAPSVQSAYPAEGASVPAGVVILKIVFDRAMDPDAWAFGPVAAAAYPDCLAKPRLLADQRTFVLMCMVPVNRTFALQVNATPRFASDYGRLATPFTVRFSTTGEVSEDLHQALLRAGLRDEDDPIMSEDVAVQGVSQTPAPP